LLHDLDLCEAPALGRRECGVGDAVAYVRGHVEVEGVCGLGVALAWFWRGLAGVRVRVGVDHEVETPGAELADLRFGALPGCAPVLSLLVEEGDDRSCVYMPVDAHPAAGGGDEIVARGQELFEFDRSSHD